MSEIERLDGMSMDIEKANMDKLKSVFPECFAEGKLDIDKLLSLCGEYIDNNFEKYKFEWKGKSECLHLAQKRSSGTLRPCKEESVNWDTTGNLYIEGDNLEALKLLQTTYYRKVKMIYIDPPYNTGNDFVYEDDFADPLARYKEVTQQTTKSNPETMGRYHTNWLNMMYPRLRLAANLLRDDGVIFISIDDNEVTNLKRLCDETFGEENFAGIFPWRKRTAKSDVPFGISQDYEWVICYAKSQIFIAGLEGGTRKYFETDDFPGRPWRIHDLTTQRSAFERPNSNFTMVNPKTGKEYPANPNRTWAVTKDTFEQYYSEGKIVFPDDYDFLSITKPAFRYFKDDDMKKAGDRFGLIPASTKLPEDIGMTQDGTKDITGIFENKVFGFPKPVSFIKYFLNIATYNDKDAIILDFFSGSATTAHAVMQLNKEDGGNRKFILVQLPELCDEKSEAYKAGYKNICEIGKERIRRAGAQLLQSDSQLSVDDMDRQPLDVGFKVFKLDSSNLKAWNGEPILDDDFEELASRMNEMIHRVKPDRTDLDMIYEVMLKMGVPLVYPVTEIRLNNKKAYSIGENCMLLVCLDEDVQPEDVEEMVEYAPGMVIISRESFKDDTAMANAYYILNDNKIKLKLL
ncbi:MAG: site-specific DNA-methyltransferase [Clostridia bacterium]|nr:site-specific DNA-methyltransferase [Clostridia bacterium]